MTGRATRSASRTRRSSRRRTCRTTPTATRRRASPEAGPGCSARSSCCSTARSRLALPVACPRVIARVTEDDLTDLLPLMRGYCDFYEVAPSDDDLLALSRALIADPERQGVQLLAREGQAVGFATIFWSWATTSAERIGVMNDLYVAPEARGTGVAEALIEACRAECAARGAGRLTWQTAPDNPAAMKGYDRVGATPQRWDDY